MMAALKASGLSYVSNSKLNDQVAQQPLVDGYKPSKDGVWEVGRKFYSNPKVMRDFVNSQDEIAIKVFYDGLPILPKGEYTVIFMQRDPAEIIESLARVGQHTAALKNAALTQANDTYPFDVYADYNPEDVQHCLDIAKQRKDCRVIEVQFRDLIEQPEKTLRSIKYNPLDRERVPIDIEKAVKVIDPDWYRSVA
jgi:hypothetical protein